MFYDEAKDEFADMIAVSSRAEAYALVALPVGLLLFLYGETLFQIAAICWQDEDYSHGLLLPFITAYLIWERRRELTVLIEEQRSRRLRISWVTFPLLAMGIVIYLIGEASGSLFASWFSLFPTLMAALLLLFGTTVGSALLLPVLLNFMAKPLPDSLVPRLFHPFQVIAARVSAKVLELLDVPVHLFGNIIEIPHMRLLVEEACSGMRSLMALLTVAFILAYLVPRRRAGTVVLIICSIVVALGLNIFRVAATGILAHFYDPKAATGFFHSFSGLIVFILGLIILFLFGKVLDRFQWSQRIQTTS